MRCFVLVLAAFAFMFCLLVWITTNWVMLCMTLFVVACSLCYMRSIQVAAQVLTNHDPVCMKMLAIWRLCLYFCLTKEQTRHASHRNFLLKSCQQFSLRAILHKFGYVSHGNFLLKSCYHPSDPGYFSIQYYATHTGGRMPPRWNITKFKQASHNTT